MTTSPTLDRPGAVIRGHDRFGQLLHAEWTKFRTVRGWVIGMAAAALIVVLLGVLTGVGSRSSYSTQPGAEEVIGHPYVPIGPTGDAVADGFQFVHQQLTGDGSITARVADLVGGRLAAGPDGPAGPAPADQQLPTGTATPWSKAGLIMKDGTAQGSGYAALMVTGGHGVRLQTDFTGDVAGPEIDGYPQWLRLTRSGATVTGFASTDGVQWTEVGTVQPGLPDALQAGMFVTAPAESTVLTQFGGGGRVTGGPTVATATFDSVALQGAWTPEPGQAEWRDETVGAGLDGTRLTGVVGSAHSGGTFTVTGAGDIAPSTGGDGASIERVLIGAFGALIISAVVGVLFITTEYRRGMVRTTFAASPRRGRVLAAKAIVIGGVTFVTGLVAAADDHPDRRTVVAGQRQLRLPDRLGHRAAADRWHGGLAGPVRRPGARHRHHRAAQRDGGGRGDRARSCCRTSWPRRRCCRPGRRTGCCGSPRRRHSPCSRAWWPTRRLTARTPPRSVSTPSARCPACWCSAVTPLPRWGWPCTCCAAGTFER